MCLLPHNLWIFQSDSDLNISSNTCRISYSIFRYNLIPLHSQTFFDDLWTKFETYQAGEDLFGMPKTEYQELHKVKKELYMLQKLYSLYNSVNNSINGYYDILWSEVDIEKINNELQEFQSRWVTSFQHFGNVLIYIVQRPKPKKGSI